MSFKTYKPVCYSEIKHITCTNTDFVLGLRFLASDHAKSAPTLPSAKRGKRRGNDAWEENTPESEEEARKQLEKNQKMALEKQKVHLKEQTMRLHAELQNTSSRIKIAHHDIEQTAEQKKQLHLKINQAKVERKKLTHKLQQQKSTEQQIEEEIKLLSEKIAKIDVAAEKIKQMGSSMSGTVKINLRRNRFPTRDALDTKKEIEWFESQLCNAMNRQKIDPTNHVQLY